MSATITNSVPDVSCGHCRTAITSEVSTLAGVESVDVDLDAKTVTVTAEPLDGAAIVAGPSPTTSPRSRSRSPGS